MSLRSLQKQWDRFGRTDPLWAVLSLPDKRHGRWDEAEFFKTGETEIADVLRQAQQLGISVARDRALDFGCGVGRLTQALLGHFERCDGVDIAPSMLEAARRKNRDPARCAYHLNDKPDLGLFPDAAFSFVYTSLVLQHMAPELSRAYIREFLRVLLPGGLLVFHLPAEPVPVETAGATRRSYAKGPLSPDAFRARLAAATTSLSGAAATESALKVMVTNEGRAAWPALAGASARFQVNLGGRFLSASGELLETREARAPLPHDLAPAKSLELFLRVPLPPRPGSYLLEIDLVQEGVAWFHERGSRAIRVPCEVTGDAGGEALRVRGAAARNAGPRFRERHPLAYLVFARLLRLPALAEASRRAFDVAAWNARMALFHLNDALRRAKDPPMEMNGIPKAQVLGLIADGGGRLVLAEDAELLLAGWQAYRYWVVRDR